MPTTCPSDGSSAGSELRRSRSSLAVATILVAETSRVTKLTGMAALCAFACSVAGCARGGDPWEESAAQYQSQSQTAPAFNPDPSLYTLHTQPPPPPQANPLPFPDNSWGDTPRSNSLPPQSPELGAFVGTVPGGPNVYVVPPGAGP